jgi:hypothetical protein
MDALVIPLKLDSGAALAELRKLSAEGAHAGKQVGDGFEGAGKQAKVLGEQISGLIAHQGYTMLRDAAQAMAQGYQQTADHVRSIAIEFAKVQDALRIVATFRGERATGEFTIEQAKMGASAGLTPDQWTNFQRQFSGFAGQFMGDGAKFSQEQGDDLAKRAAAFMNARGIEASQGGAVFGEILQQAKGDETNDELMKKFGQAYTVIEKAKGDPGPLLGQMGQVTAGGLDTTSAAKLMRAEAQRDPGEAGTYSRAVLRGLREIRTGGKSGELGITDGMNVFQQIEQIGKASDASGLKQEDFLSKYFNDEREMSGMQAALNFGVKGGLFKMADKEAADVTGKTDIEAVDTFRTNEGKRKYTEASLAAERVVAGQRMAPLQTLKTEAEAQLTKEGRFEDMTGIGDTIRSMTPGVPDVKQQIINERAYKMAREQAGESSIFDSVKGFGEEQATIDKMILETLKKIEQKTPDGANRPLAATGQPPNPASRQIAVGGW